MFELPQLPYEKDALEPIFSKETFEYHYDKHHKGYVDNLNNLIQGSKYEDMQLEQIVQNAQGTVFNNAAQHWNHDFFWKCMTPETEENQPSDSFTDLMQVHWSSLNELKKDFIDKATKQFGSGWAWIVYNTTQNDLQIVTTSNAATPLTEDGHEPLLTCDLWEHAYYIDYRNDRSKYIEKFWEVVNWLHVNDNLQQAIGS